LFYKLLINFFLKNYLFKILLGGGVPGLSLAQALLKSEEHTLNPSKKLNITIIEGPNNFIFSDFIYQQNRIPDPRVVSLTPASIRFLASIGIWEKLDKRLIKFVKGLQVWESKGSSFISFGINDLQTLKNNSIINFFRSHNLLNKNEVINFDIVDYIPDDYICAMVELNHILFHLQESVKDKINFVRNSISSDKIQIESQNDYCYLTLNYPQFNLQSNKLKKKQTSSNSLTFRTKLLVASAGSNLAIRGKMNFETAANKNNETGLICTLRGSEASEIAFQRFMHNGTFALLPLYDNLFSIVCSLPKSVNEELKKFDNSKFLAFVNDVLRNPSEMDASKLEKLISSKSVGYYKQPPLMEEIISNKLEFDLQLLQYEVNPVDKNFVLIGDSSHVIHPLAGQGLNLGVMDSAFLADEIVKALSNGRNVNDLKALQAFTYRSQMNSRLMIATVESIGALYGPTSGSLSALRNLGIAIGNSSEIMRGLFILSSSGIPKQPSKFAWEK